MTKKPITRVLCAEIDRLRVIEREYHKTLIAQLRSMRFEGEGPDAVYFSDGNKVSVAILEKLEAAGLLERIGGGPQAHIFGRLTEAGAELMGGGE